MCSLTKCREDFLEFLISVVFTKVFDVDVGELHSFGAKFHLSFLAGLKVANKTADRIKPITEGTNIKARISLSLASAHNIKNATRPLMRTNVKNTSTNNLKT